MEMGTAFVLNPYKQFAMLTLRADSPGQGVSQPDPGHWDRVVQEVNATQEQREQVSACWDLNSNILVGAVPAQVSQVYRTFHVASDAFRLSALHPMGRTPRPTFPLLLLLTCLKSPPPLPNRTEWSRMW